jgi:hypothetical protein
MQRTATSGFLCVGNLVAGWGSVSVGGTLAAVALLGTLRAGRPPGRALDPADGLAGG